MTAARTKLTWNADRGRWVAENYADNPPRSEARMREELVMCRLVDDGKITWSRAAEILRLTLGEFRVVYRQHSRKGAE